MNTNIIEAYCLFDPQATDSSTKNATGLTWGMMISDDKNASQNGFNEDVHPKIVNALTSIGSTEEAEAYYSVPTDLVHHLPDNPQDVIVGMNEKLVEAGIQDVRFVLMIDNTPQYEEDVYYRIMFGCIIDDEQLTEEGKEIAKSNDGYLCDIEDENGGDITLGIMEIGDSGKTLYLIGGEAIAEDIDECDIIFNEILQSDIYVNAVKNAYEQYVGTEAPHLEKQIIRCTD